LTSSESWELPEEDLEYQLEADKANIDVKSIKKANGELLTDDVN